MADTTLVLANSTAAIPLEETDAVDEGAHAAVTTPATGDPLSNGAQRPSTRFSTTPAGEVALSQEEGVPAPSTATSSSASADSSEEKTPPHTPPRFAVTTVARGNAQTGATPPIQQDTGEGSQSAAPSTVDANPAKLSEPSRFAVSDVPAEDSLKDSGTEVEPTKRAIVLPNPQAAEYIRFYLEADGDNPVPDFN